MSVIVPCYNEESNIAGALECLLRQDAGFPYEVMVVDSSADRTPQIVRERFPSVRLVRSEVRLSCGAARNAGLRHARGDRILFTDADVRVPPDWVRTLAAKLEHADGVGGPLENGTPWSLTGTVNYYLEFCRLLPWRGARVRRQWPFFAGANAGYRREALGVEFGSGIGEDIILNHRLLADGCELQYHPAPAVRHVNKRGFRRIARYQYHLGIGGWRWRLHSGSHRSVLRWPAVIVGAPLLMMAHLLWSQVRVPSPTGVMKVLILSPFLLGFHAFWVAGFLAGRKVCAAELASAVKRGDEVLRADDDVVARRQQPSRAGAAQADG